MSLRVGVRVSARVRVRSRIRRWEKGRGDIGARLSSWRLGWLSAHRPLLKLERRVRPVGAAAGLAMGAQAGVVEELDAAAQ